MVKNPVGRQPDLLGIYLNDHLTGAVGGVGLARRLAGNAVGGDQPFLKDLAEQIEQDRMALLRVMHALGVPVSPTKTAVGWLAEKVARLKLNGRLIHRSPLSDVIEVEGMYLGVQGKAAAWRVLRGIADRDDRLDAADFDRLIERAQTQADGLERLRRSAAAKAFPRRQPRVGDSATAAGASRSEEVTT